MTLTFKSKSLRKFRMKIEKSLRNRYLNLIRQDKYSFNAFTEKFDNFEYLS